MIAGVDEDSRLLGRPGLAGIRDCLVKAVIRLPMKQVLKTDRNHFELPALAEAFVQNYRAGIARPVVLLADGNREGRTALGQGLRRSGFVVREVGLAAEVEEVAALVMPDVILLDARFPDGEGADVVRELKAGQGTARIPVIVLGTPALERCRQDCLGVGAVAILNKPVCVHEATAAVRQHLVKPAATKVDF